MDLEQQLRALLARREHSAIEWLDQVAHSFSTAPDQRGAVAEFVAACETKGVIATAFSDAARGLGQGGDKRAIWRQLQRAMSAQPLAIGQHPATDEQQQIIEAACRGEHLWIAAGAGASKTSTLVAITQYHPCASLYLAFNRGIANQAQQRFPNWVESKTLHALALKHLPEHLRQSDMDLSNAHASRDMVMGLMEAVGDRWPTRDINDWIARFGTDDSPGRVGANELRLIAGRAWQQLLTQVDPMLALPALAEGIAQALSLQIKTAKQRVFLEQLVEQSALPRLLSEAGAAVWQDFTDGRYLTFGFNEMLRLFGLSGPLLPIKLLLVDEAQDLNPLMLNIIQRHRSAGVQVILVGDSAQAIYGWNGSIDAMQRMRHSLDWTICQLSTTFRCSPAVTALANDILAANAHTLRLRAAGPASPAPHQPELAAICRTNAGCVQMIASYANRGKKVYCPKKPDSYLLWQLFWLKLGKADKVEHPELKRYPNWNALGDSIRGDQMDRDMRLAYKIIDQDPGDFSKKLKAMKTALVDTPQRADVAVMTAHAAKGLEYLNVRLGEDFFDVLDEAGPDGRAEELNILYVAVTRAMNAITGKGMAAAVRSAIGTTRAG
ncbi:AAA family ATPase [Litorivicinus lipolyticus]|uniref:DNA 3'-5' helicase n=1 Tax=Litorivicinus lipolyticus TaxID=418701 RepID=A0A5Q2Q705_9GAMM|nr:UvrD-helicase domain-containing protein [Litorivicinus lipolyticus]QGG80139.1 AAA family ATPase [Litorivicinus lipolyticus]